MTLISLQGISDAVAFDYDARHGGVRYAEIEAALRAEPSCPRLRSYWHFDGCGYRKGAGTCAEPDHRPRCPLPTHPLRKGVLNQAAYSLFLFIRDVCGGDLVGWIDARLAGADLGLDAPDRGSRMREALLKPLRNIQGVSDKLLAMMLSELLLGGDPGRERWVAAGTGLIAVDTLVHNFLHRTGMLSRFGAEHPYEAGCYAPNACASIIAALAERIDAREFNSAFPACFPRFVQHAIWRFCSVGVLDVCNGNRIDDRGRCENGYCPTFEECDRQPLRAG